MIGPHEAWSRLLPHVPPRPPERIPRRGASGRVLAEDLTATVDVPPCDVSAMDGFALAGAVRPGDRLPVAGVIAAGDAPGFELAPGTTARIMTGAPVPAGADRVLPVEQTASESTGPGPERVRMDADPGAGANIRRRAEVLERGAPLLPAGTLLTPGALSVLATHGVGEIAVHRAPRVKVLTTGDEVVSPESTPRPGQLRDSNTDFLLAAGASLGLDFRSLGIAPDRREDLTRAVERGLDGDVLLLCGGVSMGEFDFVEDVLETLGHRLLFDAVAIQPGKPLVAAVPKGSGKPDRRALVFGLPGNPASVMVCFWLFVRPALRRMLGSEDGYWYGALAGELATPLPGAKGRDRFLAAGTRFEAGRLKVTPHPPKGSHDLAAYAHGGALVRVSAHAEPATAGDSCEVLPLVDWR
jgi:molybdopterin molybdotransferase